jgi:hypothetical protein
MVLSKNERRLLDRLAAEGKATRLLDEELATAKDLEAAGLLFLVGTTAVVTPRARRLLAELEQKPPKPPKPPFSLLE